MTWPRRRASRRGEQLHPGTQRFQHRASHGQASSVGVTGKFPVRAVTYGSNAQRRTPPIHGHLRSGKPPFNDGPELPGSLPAGRRTSVTYNKAAADDRSRWDDGSVFDNDQGNS